MVLRTCVDLMSLSSEIYPPMAQLTKQMLLLQTTGHVTKTNVTDIQIKLFIRKGCFNLKVVFISLKIMSTPPWSVCYYSEKLICSYVRSSIAN